MHLLDRERIPGQSHSWHNYQPAFISRGKVTQPALLDGIASKMERPCIAMIEVDNRTRLHGRSRVEADFLNAPIEVEEVYSKQCIHFVFSRGQLN